MRPGEDEVAAVGPDGWARGVQVVLDERAQYLLDGQRVAELRAVSQTRFAEACGWGRSRQSRLESGRGWVTAATLASIVRALRKTVPRGGPGAY